MLGVLIKRMSRSTDYVILTSLCVRALIQRTFLPFWSHHVHSWSLLEYTKNWSTMESIFRLWYELDLSLHSLQRNENDSTRLKSSGSTSSRGVGIRRRKCWKISVKFRIWHILEGQTNSNSWHLCVCSVPSNLITSIPPLIISGSQRTSTSWANCSEQI